MMRILVYPNRNKPAAGEILKKIIQYTKDKNVEICIPTSLANHFGYPELAQDSGDKNTIDVAISIGGDGTLLGLARSFSKFGIPVCGINIGRLGFLADIELEHLEKSIDKIISKDFVIRERLLLIASICRDGEIIPVGVAVNDIVVAKCGVSRMLHLDLSINDYPLTDYRADGLIVATPTGSTAYSLSAGGPIVSPKVQGILVTPICPHTSSIRPLVIDKEEVVKIRFLNEKSISKRSINLTIDGQESVNLKSTDQIIVSQAPYTAKILKFDSTQFYQTLKNKLCIGS